MKRRRVAREDAAQASAHSYDERGWAPTPVRPRSKKPRLAKWQTKRLSKAEIDEQFRPGDNIGLVLGERSGGLTDIDLDAPEALTVAADFLPPTPMRHGRRGKRASHSWYVPDPPLRTEKFADIDGTMLVEVRSTGAVTIVPPSIHPGGARLTWEGAGEPARVQGSLLRAAVARLAACILAARHWPKRGRRHDCALALAGFLLRLGLPDAEATAFVSAVARAAGDEEIEDRVASAVGTALAQAEGRATTGGLALAKALRGDGQKVVRRLEQWLQPDFSEASHLPAIDASYRDLPRLADQAWTALAASNDPPVLFLHGNIFVRLRHEHPSAMYPISRDGLRHRLARIGSWYKVTASRERKPDLPPMHLVRDMLVEPEPRLPILRRLVEVPVFGPDGKLNTTPGYQAETGSYYLPPPGFVLPEIPENPTPSEIARARELLSEELLGDFPFVEPADRAHAIAVLLLPFVRDLIAGPTPLHLIEKPSPGTGGTLLASVLALPALGRLAPAMTEGGDDAEWRKRLTAKLLESPAMIHIDNVHGRLQSAALAAVLTSTVWEDRVLGESRIARVPVHAAFIATGNNPALGDEIARRTVRIRLDAGMERPWMRADFLHPDLKGWAMTHRPDLVWAVAVLVRAWLAAGRPAGHGTMGMFESWAQTLGGICDVADIRGFLENQRQFYEESATDAGILTLFVKRWAQQYGPRAVSVSDLYQLVREDGLPLDLHGRDDHALRTSLGMLLRRHRDRLYGRFRIQWVGERGNAQLWKVVEVGRSPTAAATRARRG